MAYEVRRLFSWDTEYSADSAEFCPIAPYHDYLAVGTYQLVNQSPQQCDQIEGVTVEQGELPKKRLGRLYLHKMTEDRVLQVVQNMDMPAILDMKWCHHMVYGLPLLAIANASGQVLIYALKDGNSYAVLKLFCQYEIGKDTLVLSLDWSTNRIQSERPQLTLSDSKGNITLLELNEGLTMKQTFLAHDFEAWITAFDCWNPNIVYTGGDDSKFKKFDVRTEPGTAVVTSRAHDAGVTSIHSNVYKEFLLVTGSYDENVNVWDTRKLRFPLFSQSVGGGVWRLKFDPHNGDLLLAACMHNGFHVVDINDKLQVKASFSGHESLAYGADWYCGLENSTKTVASASFYDHLLCLWEFTVPA
ncbi:hypothetical protein Pcinc_012814 [Petrolisthes cinctipes]|uniref:methylated diphthine methylhydrolase n=1 Tax=Petrolisthes cinctipes TaxID=88211 RepID=A0AAE1FZU4_PETCI|nr:hypothetical protein Pcinc_012814 [Petrolisthes cinctipes]